MRLNRIGFAAVVAAVAACADQGPTAAELEAMLRNPDDPSAHAIDAKTEAWLLLHRKSIHSLTSTDFGDLRFLAPLIGNRRLVQLGEVHGVEQDYAMKVRLVKYLHEELGFDVVAFESGFYECWKTDLGISAQSNHTGLLNSSCLYGIWGTPEVDELFDYLKRRRTTARPLRVAGFDPAAVSATLVKTMGRHAFVLKALAHLDDTLVTRLADTDSTFVHYQYYRNQTARTLWLSENEARVRADYERLRQLAGQHRALIGASVPELPNAALLLGRTAANAIAWLDAGTASPLTAFMRVRDSAMASNTDFLLDTLYAGRKVIVWAHNHHVGNIPYDAGSWFLQSMGRVLAEKRRSEMYTIGFYRYRGTPGSGAQAFSVPPHEPGALEAILYHARRKILFVDMLQAQRSDSTEWMFTPIPSYDNGLTIFRNKYDAIIQIDSVSQSVLRPILPGTPPITGVPF